MKLLHLTVVFALFAIFTLSVEASDRKSPVVVELFTSEACSSCPPADRLLLELQRTGNTDGADLILLGEHVDYWDHLGWKDRFSSARFTARQAQYADLMKLPSAYTPQMVVDGHIDVLGNDSSALRKAIAAAASTPKATQVNLSWTTPNQLNIAVSNAGKSHVLLAITENDLTTDVKNGENRGRTLHHADVVRELRDLGPTVKGEWQRTINPGFDSHWDRSKLRVIVLIQQQDGRILGASSLGL